MKPKESFNHIADLYNEVRPQYPNAVIDWIVDQTGVELNHKLLEIAPGTGQATIKFACRGYNIQAVELGHNLARLLEENCKEYNVNVDVGAFEGWQSKEKYDLIYCATAFHWIDPEVKYKKCYDLLEGDAKLVLIWHMASGTLNPIVQEAYDTLWSYYPDRALGKKHEKSLQERRKDEITDSGYFDLGDYLEHTWVHPQSKVNYIKGFKTQSSYTVLNENDKRDLDQKLEILFDGLPDEVETEFVTRVYVCDKKKRI